VKCFTGTLTKTEKLHNDLPVIVMCLAKLCTYERLLASKFPFVSMLHWPLWMKTYKCYIVTGDKFAIQALCSTHYFYVHDNGV